MRGVSLQEVQAAYDTLDALVVQHDLGGVKDSILEMTFAEVVDEIRGNLALLELPADLLDGRPRPLRSMVMHRIECVHARVKMTIYNMLLWTEGMRPHLN